MCKQCEKNPVYEFTNKRKLCKKCFIRYFQKKFLYTLRRFKMIKRGDVVGYAEKSDFHSVVLKDSLGFFSESGIIEVVKLPSKKNNKVAMASSFDSESDKFVHSLVKENMNNLKQFSPVDFEKKTIKPLYLFSDKEILLYAKLRRLSYKEFKHKKDKLSLFIDSLEKKHPEIKRAIINSYLELYEKNR